MNAVRRARSCSGSAVLYAILLSPVILLSLALVVEAGGLQLQRQRLVEAADVATTTGGAFGAQPDDAGRIDSALASATLRRGLADNLAPLAADLSGTDPAGVAAGAEVATVTEVPASDPFRPGGILRRPTIEARVRAPVHSGLLAIAGLPRTLTLTVVSSADLQVGGPATAPAG